MSLVNMERIPLKNSRDINESMIQEFIFNNASSLGLGDLTPIQREKVQPSGGKLDLLLADDSNTRYEDVILMSEEQKMIIEATSNMSKNN